MYIDVDDVRQLGADSMLRIQIGVDHPPIYISKAVLGNVSSGLDSLVKTATPAVGEKHDDDLSVPEDDPQAWKALFYWIVKKELPAKVNDSQPLLVHSWALGEKYEVIDFQNDAMLQLLRYSNTDPIKNEAIESAFALTQPGSKLRKLMAEELIRKVEDPGERLEALDIPYADGVEVASGAGPFGMVTELLNAQRRYAQCGDAFFERFAEREDHRFERWKDFMEGNGMAVRGRATKAEREEDLGESEYSSEASD